MKTTRGGKRAGAGRKPRATPREAITVRIEPDDANRLRSICLAQHVSQAKWITGQIKKDNT
jgi:predicted HicB family RNase H-like nuclease